MVILDDLLKPRFTHGLVEFLVRGASLPLRSRDYQLVHRSLFLFLCLPFFAFLVAGLPAGLVTVSSSRSSWAACSADASRASHFCIMACRNSSRSHGGRRDRLPSVFREKRSEEIPTCRWFSSCTQSRTTLLVPSARARPQVFLTILSITGFLHKGFDSTGSLWGSVADAHPLFQVGVLQGLFDWDLLYERFDPLCGLSLL